MSRRFAVHSAISWWDDIHPTITRRLAGEHHVRLSTPPDAGPLIAYQSGS
jgi:hypothetical protein